MRFETTGRSMWPLLRPGDVARIDPLDRPARPGDIVVYVDPVHVDPDGRPVPRLIAHRVIEVLPDGHLRLRGDFTFSAEPPVEQTRIVGRLTSVERAGRIVDLHGPLARLLAFGLPRVERAAPGALAGLRRAVIRGVQVADGLWTAGPVRRVRRVAADAGTVVEVQTIPGPHPSLDAHLRRSARAQSHRGGPSSETIVVAALRAANGAVVGSARAVRASPTDWLLDDVYVEHRWRGLGVGRAVIERMLGEAGTRQPGASMVADVAVSDRRALNLLMSLGFREFHGLTPGGDFGANQSTRRLARALPPFDPAHIVGAPLPDPTCPPRT